MAYRRVDLPGPTLVVGDRAVTPVARLTEVGFVTESYGAGFQYLRPVRLDIEGPAGAQISVALPDRTFQLRLLAIAIVVLAYVVGRMRT